MDQRRVLAFGFEDPDTPTGERRITYTRGWDFPHSPLGLKIAFYGGNMMVIAEGRVSGGMIFPAICASNDRIVFDVEITTRLLDEHIRRNLIAHLELQGWNRLKNVAAP